MAASLPGDFEALETPLREEAARFAVAWRDGHSPPIEVSLAKAPAEARERFRTVLLRIEIEARLRTGQSPTLEEYAQRFPEVDPKILESIFLSQATMTVPSTTPQVGTDASVDLGATRPSDTPTGVTPTWSTASEMDVAGRQLRPGSEPVPGFCLVKKLGKGGFGEVWEASAPGAIKVALKLVPLDRRTGALELKALEVIKEIRHPNLLTIFGAWQIGGLLVIGMERADRSLHDRFEECSRTRHAGIPARELLRYLQECAKVIDFLNKPRHYLGGPRPVGIQHGDIKPQNLLLLSGGIKVADFGLVQLLEHHVADRTSGLTPAYAAPECFGGQTSRWSDQYSLAVTYVHLRTGQLPFKGRLDELRQAHQQHLPNLSALPAKERPVIERALAKEPHARWPNCRMFVKALVEAMRSADGTGQPPIAEGYKIGRRLGAGGMGTSYEAETADGRPVRIDVYSLPVDEGQREQLIAAYRSLARIQHPGLVSLWELKVEVDQLTLVSERATFSLAERLAQCQADDVSGIPKDELVGYLSLVAEGVDFLHAHGIRHRNIKPSNIVLFALPTKPESALSGGSIRYRAALQPSSVLDSHLAEGAFPGTVLGTPAYMAPEALQFGAVDASDQYSLAATYFELRTGRRIYPDQNVMELVHAVLSEPPKLEGLLPFEEAVLRRALARLPQDRFSSCREFVDALTKATELALEEGEAMSAPGPMVAGKAGPFKPPSRYEARKARPGATPPLPSIAMPPVGHAIRRRILALLGVAATLLIATAIAFSLRSSRYPKGLSLPTSLAPTSSELAMAPKPPTPKEDAKAKLVEGPRQPPEPKLARGGTESLPIPPPPKKATGVPNPGDEKDLSTEPAAIPGMKATASEPAPPAEPVAARPAELPSAPRAEAVGAGEQSRSETESGTLVSSDHETWLLGGITLAGILSLVLTWYVRRRRAARPASQQTPSARAPARKACEPTRSSTPAPAEPVSILEGHTEPIWAVAFTPSGEWCATAGADNFVRLWGRDAPAHHRYFRLPDGITSITFTLDGRRLLGASLDSKVYNLDVETGEMGTPFSGHVDGVTCVHLSPDGQLAATGSRDRTVRLWEVSTGRERARWLGHTDWVHAVAFTPDGRQVLSGGKDRTLRLWDVASGTEVRRFEGHASAVNGLAIDPAGKWAVSGSGGPGLNDTDHSLRIWDLSTGKEIRRLTGHDDWVRAVAVSPNGRWILSGSDDETLRLWDAHKGQEVHKFEGHTWSVVAVAFAPDGHQALSGSDDLTARLWQLPPSA